MHAGLPAGRLHTWLNLGGFGNPEAGTRIDKPFLAVFHDSKFLHSGLPSAVCMHAGVPAG